MTDDEFAVVFEDAYDQGYIDALDHVLNIFLLEAPEKHSHDFRISYEVSRHLIEALFNDICFERDMDLAEDNGIV